MPQPVCCEGRAQPLAAPCGARPPARAQMLVLCRRAGRCLLPHSPWRRGSLQDWVGLSSSPGAPSLIESLAGQQSGWIAVCSVCATRQVPKLKLFLAPWMPKALSRAINFLLESVGGTWLGGLPKVVPQKTTPLPLGPATQGLSVPRAGCHRWGVRTAFHC